MARYNVHRSTTAFFTPTALNRIAQPTTTSYTDSGLAAGTYYYRVVAEDAASNFSAPSAEAIASVTGDTVSPTAPGGLTATAGPGQAALSWTPSSDNVGVTRYNVHRATSAGFTPSAANRIGQPTGTGYTDSGLAAGTYYYKVIAEDAAGNVSPPSAEVAATVSSAPPPTGLVAAYGFEEGSGTNAADLSGTGNGGTISGATRTTAGRFGSALTFDGVNDWVTVADANSLDLTSGMTLEAWLRPTAAGNGWRTAIMKEQAGNYAYALYAHTGSNQPSGNGIIGGTDRDIRGTSALALNTWTHLSATYDGSQLRLFVNGAQTAAMAATGNLVVTTGALRIGGTGVWPEWFAGQIDEVRIYSRALSAAEITADMNRSVGNPDTQAPTAPTGLTATVSLSSVALTWTAATDNTGVTRYNVHRGTVAAFIPGVGNRIAQPTGTTYTDTGLAAGTYFYKVVAEDAASNLSPPSNEAIGTVTGDTSAPTAPTGLTANGSLSSVALSWAASTDNVGVTRYNVHRSTTAGFTPSAANRVAQPTGTSYSDTGLAAGTYFYRVTAEDAATNVSPPSNQASAAVTGDTSRPTAPTSLAATVVGGNVNLTWTASTDNVGIARQRPSRDGCGLPPVSGESNRAADRCELRRYQPRTRNVLLQGHAEDAATNVSPPSIEASATVSSAPPPTGLVAAYSFDEGSGSVAERPLGNRKQRGDLRCVLEHRRQVRIGTQLRRGQ